MILTSIHFLVFISVSLIIYYSLPFKLRWILLLLASYYFYACWNIGYAPLLFFLTWLDYIIAKKISRQQNDAKNKRLLIISIISNIAVLVLFKYTAFLLNSIGSLFDSSNIASRIPLFHLLLPLGISYFTLKKLSYLLDVYHHKIEPERHLGKFALYVAFFPAIAAGPIDRAGHLLPQFHEKMSFKSKHMTAGLELLMWGFFKKFVLADRLAVLVNQTYNFPHEKTGLTLLIATYLYSFQIFCDFSGYTDIALGTASLFGFQLTQNFHRPYFAGSIADFWRRWHISFTSWMRDYVFLPLSYSLLRRFRFEKLFFMSIERWAYTAGIIITWGLVGLWHGAAWTFVIWGSLHGFYLISSNLTKKIRKKVHRRIKIKKKWPKIYKLSTVFMTFHLVTLAWIFFRANSLHDAFFIIKKIASVFRFQAARLQLDASQLSIALLGVFFLFLSQWIHSKMNIHNALARQPIWIRWGIYYLFIYVIFLFGRFGTTHFIYFQF